ncbi:MAG: hypothetical protein P8X50_06795 [Maritimibacter sp.]
MSSFATSSGAAAGWSFPASFVDTMISICATLRGVTAGVATVDAVTTSGANIHSFDMSGSNSPAPNVDLIATGRWF